MTVVVVDTGKSTAEQSPSLREAYGIRTTPLKSGTVSPDPKNDSRFSVILQYLIFNAPTVTAFAFLLKPMPLLSLNLPLKVNVFIYVLILIHI